MLSFELSFCPTSKEMGANYGFHGSWFSTNKTVNERVLQEVQILCSLVCGIVQNFSKTNHSCRKCLVSRDALESADCYNTIHSKFQIQRTDESLLEAYEEAKLLNVTHVFGVKELSIFKDFPYFNSCKQLPQETIQNYVD